MSTVSLDRQLVYLHFPKTAGTSYAQHVVPILGNRLPLTGWREAEREDLDQFDFVHGHIYFDQVERLSDKPLMMTMLRHPIERIFSLYRFQKRRPQDPMYETVNSMTFHEFVERRYGTQVYISMLTDTVSGEEEGPKPSRQGRERVELALERLERFEVLGITEYFPYSLLLLSRELNIEPFWQIGTANTAPTPTTRDDLEPETIKLLRQVAGADIEIYDRAVELFKERVRQMIGTPLPE